LPELPAERAELQRRARRRRIRHASAQRLSPTDVIDSRRLDELGRDITPPGGDRLEGTAVAPGRRTGPARIVLDPAEAGDLPDGYILVCPSTDPGWTPLLINAAGLIVERGGVLSHGAIVARDFGIPAVVIPAATRQITDGDTLSIDGEAGAVAVVQPDGV
jgi:pyruvate,water dikinase